MQTAPGHPGISPRWTTSSKDGVGTSINTASTITFTLSHGILNEVYFPREDKAAMRDMGLIVTNGNDFFSEEKRDTGNETLQYAPGIPAFTITNTCRENRYRIVKEVITDPRRYTLLQRITFTALQKDDYRLFALLAPHLKNMGDHNTAWVGDYKGHPVLFAKNEDVVLAFLCSEDWLHRSVGFVGTSDGWPDLQQNKEMTALYTLAEDGNVALTGEISLTGGTETTVNLAIGFGAMPEEAAHHALSTLLEGFDVVHKRYVAEWQNWHKSLRPLHDSERGLGEMFRTSAAVLRTHQSKIFPGAIMASLSIPWGDNVGDDTNTGYHLVWPRDLVECAGGLLALEAYDDALKTVNYLMTTQEGDGHWSQNMWVGGTPFWGGVQLDETALPILLIDRCRELNLVPKKDLPKYWRTVSKAVTFLLTHGLISDQERWEEQSGISVFTVATMVAALLSAADLADAVGEKEIATHCRQTADAWNESIDTWLYARDTRLCQENGVEGYYLRINPTTTPAAELGDATMTIKNRPADQSTMPVVEMVSIDPLALVRFGLRAADDPRMISTLKVIDDRLIAHLPTGTSWYRYVNDGYGEHEDGSSYDGTGTGRPWPLLTAERAHYEIAAGNSEYALKLLHDVERFSNNGLLSEQIWDQEDIPGRGLYKGEHSGSAMPLAWAHAEHLKLVCSIKTGKIFDLPRHTTQRYLDKKKPPVSRFVLWRTSLPVTSVARGKTLRIETVQPAAISWTTDDWESTNVTKTAAMGLGIHFLDLAKLKSGTLEFTINWLFEDRWEGKNFIVTLG